MKYFDSSPDPFHAVQTSVDMLEEAGFVQLDTEAPYKNQLKAGGKYYFTKNKSTLVAFAIGNEYTPGNGGFKIIGGHTDSPNLKIKPRSKLSGANGVGSTGCIQLRVECYGGGLWNTWFDRDLGLSGRVFVRDEESGKIEQKLVLMDRALLRIPNLAIHLQDAKEREAFKANKEDHLVPILSMAVKDALTGNGGSSDGDKDKEGGDSSSKKDTVEDDGWTEYQEPILMDMLASELNVEKKSIIDFEMNLFDVQKASLGGAYSEFVHSARLDNLASCFMAIEGLVEYTSEEGMLASDQDISLVALFDHEEIGSQSATGAGSPIMGEAVERICAAFQSDETVDVHSKSIARSFVLSVDQAHAIHPNYANKHEKGHSPKMNDGMVIKRNSNQRYATTGITGLIVREIAKKAGLKPIQEFVVRNDCGCGSTIGPIISSSTGMRAIDMGCPQLSMHSIRESMGTSDLTNGVDVFIAFFKHFREIDDSIVDKN
jgi:aspartyl aminopeptidase